MSKRASALRCFRIAAIGIVLLAFAAFLLVELHRFLTPLRPPSAAQCLAAAEEGQPVVKAILEYKHRIGLWPQRVEDLEPGVRTQASKQWTYFWSHSGYLVFERPVSLGGGVKYVFPDREWRMYAYEKPDRVLSILTPRFDAPEISEEERTQNTLTELTRRIAREPEEIVHWQGKISFLRRLERIAEARQECDECALRFPRHWWPQMARAYIDAERGKANEAAAAFREWVAGNPSFAHYWYLSEFYRTIGAVEQAIGALADARQYELASGPNDTLVPSFFACEAAAYAYQQKQFALALEICDVWERFGGASSCNALRAAAYLALGEFDKAEANMRKALHQESYKGVWIEITPSLKSAIESRNKSYHDPSFGPRFAPFNVFITYE